MGRYIISMIILLIFVSISGADDDGQRISALKKISAAKLQRIACGLEQWPAEIFPISYWNDEDKKKLPEEYWQKLRECEKKWPDLINREQRLFRNEYGHAVNNTYDLFLKEQAEMRRPGYSTPGPPVLEKKSLCRLIDIAFLQGKNFAGISGTAVSSVRVLSYRQNKLRIIPFDIIEFTDSDRVVLPHGPEGNPGDGNGVFSGNDKLFFMAADAGHRINTDYIKGKHPSVKKIEEVEILYAPDREKGWVYVSAFEEEAPAISPFDMIEFFPEYSMFFTLYCYNQCEPRSMDGNIVPTLKVSTWCGAPNIGCIPFDVNDRLRIRIKLKYILGSTEDNEDSSNVSWRAWYQGRVVNYNRAVFKVSTPFGIGAPAVFDDIIASPLSFSNYLNWRTPFDPSIIMKYLDVLVGEQLNERVLRHKDILKVTYLREKDKKGYRADGIMSDEEKNRGNDYSSWHLYTSFINTVLMRTDYDDFMKKNSRVTLEWNDSAEETGNYDNHLVMDSFKRRNHHFYVEWNAVPFFWNENPLKYNWKSLDTVLKRIDRPLVYRVSCGEPIKPGPIVHIPDIKKEQDEYRY